MDETIYTYLVLNSFLDRWKGAILKPIKPLYISKLPSYLSGHGPGWYVNAQNTHDWSAEYIVVGTSGKIMFNLVLVNSYSRMLQVTLAYGGQISEPITLEDGKLNESALKALVDYFTEKCKEAWDDDIFRAKLSTSDDTLKQLSKQREATLKKSKRMIKERKMEQIFCNNAHLLVEQCLAPKQYVYCLETETRYNASYQVDQVYFVLHVLLDKNKEICFNLTKNTYIKRLETLPALLEHASAMVKICPSLRFTPARQYLPWKTAGSNK